MDASLVVLLASGMLVAAFLYATVGHGGASAYIAAMALAGIAPAEMRPIALQLNVLVSALATFKFYRAGHFRWPLFWPFAVVSIPAAYLGGAITLPGSAYKVLVGVVLLYAGWQLWWSARAGRGAAAGAPTSGAARDGDRRGTWRAVGADRGRRRHLPQPDPAALRLGGNQADVGRRGAVHPRQFAGGAGGGLCKESAPSRPTMPGG